MSAESQEHIRFVEKEASRLGHGREQVVPLLLAVQENFGWLSEAALLRVAELVGASPADIVGVATFYSRFRLRPMGRHLIRVCDGTTCHVKGAPVILEALRRTLGLKAGEDTDSGGVFTIQPVACLGCCTLAPVLQIGSVTYGHLRPESLSDTLAAFLEHEKRRGKEAPGKAAPLPRAGCGQIRVGSGSCCLAGGAGGVREALEAAVRRQGTGAAVRAVGCVGMCHNTPLVEVITAEGKTHFYARAKPEDADAIVRRHFPAGGIAAGGRRIFDAFVARLLLGPDAAAEKKLDTGSPSVIGFLSPQKRISTEGAGVSVPLDLDAYAADGGFQALEKILREGVPDEVIAAITASGLRGRGGAGFPTGRKWALVRAAAGSPKYVVCNGDEGDPGAFMDRMLLESRPYRVLEGMAIAAFAVGAEECLLFIRAEYPLALARMKEAILRWEERRSPGGKKTGLPAFRVVEGAGAFVCGEETALLESLMGRRGTPRSRPPFPSESGFRDKPTLVNNVETFALIPGILLHGPEAFSSLGTRTSSGTKVFALTGKVVRTGLIEVPMGLSIRRIVEEIGGGVAPGRSFKAVQIGGPSGGCLPAALAETQVDYEALTGQGAMMGSGGLVVMDDLDCMVDMARYFLSFTQIESCGKCTFCRVGTKRMLEILERICEGKGQENDISELENLAAIIKKGSLCGLGKSAPNPVLSTIRHFREEYEAHIRGRCPAGKCRGLIRYSINDKCIGCTLCAQRCPVDAIPITPYKRHEIDPELCIRCDTCRQVCPSDAVEVR